MVPSKLATQFLRKGADKEKLAQRVRKKPELVPELLECLQDSRAPVKYGAEKILRILSDTAPELLYPEIEFFIEQLDSEKNILRWGAIYVLGNLAKVDDRGRIDEILEHYLAPIRGDVLITAANTVAGAVRIALARPEHTEDIITSMLRVEKANYATPECRNVALGQVVTSLDELFDQAQRKRRILNFMRRQLENPRPAVRKKAEKFLRKHTGR